MSKTSSKIVGGLKQALAMEKAAQKKGAIPAASKKASIPKPKFAGQKAKPEAPAQSVVYHPADAFGWSSGMWSKAGLKKAVEALDMAVEADLKYVAKYVTPDAPTPKPSKPIDTPGPSGTMSEYPTIATHDQGGSSVTPPKLIFADPAIAKLIAERLSEHEGVEHRIEHTPAGHRIIGPDTDLTPMKPVLDTSEPGWVKVPGKKVWTSEPKPASTAPVVMPSDILSCYELPAGVVKITMYLKHISSAYFDVVVGGPGTSAWISLSKSKLIEYQEHHHGGKWAITFVTTKKYAASRGLLF